MNRLFIRVKEKDRLSIEEPISLEDSLTWLLMSDEGDVIQSGMNMSALQIQTSLEDKQLSYKDVVVFPPDHRIHIRRLSLSKGQHRHIEKITPYLLEEFLAQSPEDLHVTLLSKKDKNAVWVAAVAKEYMTAWCASLVEMGWQNAQFLSIGSLLPFWPNLQEDLPFLFSCEDGYLLKDDHSIVYLPTTLLEKLPKRECYQLSCDKNHIDNFPLANTQLETLSLWSNTQLDDKGKSQSWFYTLASTVQKERVMMSGNLRHGDYLQQSQNKIKLAPWLIVASLALFSLCAELYLSVRHADQLNQQAAQIESKNKADFLKLAPDEGRVFYLNRQIQGRIKQAAQGGGKQQTYNIYDMMYAIDKVREQVKGSHRIVKLDFSNKVIRLDWEATERETLDQLQEIFQTSSVNAVMEQITKRGESYLASIKIELEGNKI